MQEMCGHTKTGKKLSLIIATYNRGAKLMITLDSLLCQTLPVDMWEVVVVDNNSTDDTKSLFDAYAVVHHELDLHMVNERVQGVSAARNRGLAESRGEYIVVIDDDEVVVPRFLQDYYDLFESESDVAGAGGRILPRFESEPPRWMSSYTERAIAGTLDLGDSRIDFPVGKFFGGGNHGFRRSVLERYGGYDTALGRTGNVSLSGEEKELYGRLTAGGERVVYLPEAIIYHLINPERLTKSYFVKLCRNIGRSERRRTLGISSKKYAVRLLSEAVKWGGAVVVGLGYLLQLKPAKSLYLLIMRWQITRGLIAG